MVVLAELPNPTQNIEGSARREKPHPVVDSLREIQAIQKQFQTTLGTDNSPGMIIDWVHQEAQELHEAIEIGNRAEIASELADIIILTMGIAASLDIPMDIAVSDKMMRNATKYNPAVIRELRKQGMSPHEAMQHLKHQWDKSRDKEFSRG